jgi:carbonic anhydrase/acetyltransferase-like protein (isoleucine patch superfamily)
MLSGGVSRFVSILAPSPQFLSGRRRFRPICHLHAGQQIDVAVITDGSRLAFTSVSKRIRILEPDNIELLQRVIFIAHAIIVALRQIQTHCLVGCYARLAQRLDIELRNAVANGNVVWPTITANDSNAIFM